MEASDVGRVMVPPAMSDLFFNRDLKHCEVVEDNKQFTGWNEELLADEAESTLHCLASLGVDNLPSVEQLVADFMERV